MGPEWGKAFSLVLIYSLHENFLNFLASRTSGLFEFTGPNGFYRPPKVYHKKFDKNQKPVGLLDFQFSLAQPHIHWPRSSDQWVFVKTEFILEKSQEPAGQFQSNLIQIILE
jgi:hypothetical protein